MPPARRDPPQAGRIAAPRAAAKAPLVNESLTAGAQAYPAGLSCRGAKPAAVRPRAWLPAPARLATYFHVHLVSDSTGETLNALARAVCARFTNVLPIEHIYALVRSARQLERALEEIANAPGVVLHTIIDPALRGALEEGCQAMDMPCIAALDPLVSALSRYLGAPLSTKAGAQYALDADYFNRIDALNYALSHDDGQGGQELSRADVVLVGVSRTSKTPTCIYLAHRGVRAANVPLVPGGDAPPAKLTTTARAPDHGADPSARPAAGDPPQPPSHPQRAPREQLR